MFIVCCSLGIAAREVVADFHIGDISVGVETDAHPHRITLRAVRWRVDLPVDLILNFTEA